MTATNTEPKRPTRRASLLGVIEVLGVIVLIIMMLHVVINALTRSFLRAPILGTLELTEFWYMPALALLGLVAAQARNEHIVADLLFDSFPPIARTWTSVAVNLITAVVAAGIAWYGVGEMIRSMSIGRTAGATDFPLWPVEGLLAAAYIVFAVQLVWMAVRIARHGEPAVAAHDDPDGMPNDDGVGFGDDPILREHELADMRERERSETDPEATR